MAIVDYHQVWLRLPHTYLEKDSPLTTKSYTQIGKELSEQPPEFYNITIEELQALKETEELGIMVKLPKANGLWDTLDKEYKALSKAQILKILFIKLYK